MALITVIGKPALTVVINLPGKFFSVCEQNKYLRHCCDLRDKMTYEEIDVSICLFMIVVLWKFPFETCKFYYFNSINRLKWTYNKIVQFYSIAYSKVCDVNIEINGFYVMRNKNVLCTFLINGSFKLNLIARACSLYIGYYNVIINNII